jgi:hypothetical protein
MYGRGKKYGGTNGLGGIMPVKNNDNICLARAIATGILFNLFPDKKRKIDSNRQLRFIFYRYVKIFTQ